MANITPRCWNCGNADKWTEVAAMEKCDSCGIACFYHGSGANEAYRDAMEAKYAREERLADESEQRQRREEQQSQHDEEECGYINSAEYY